jgi:hypothetical protein
VRGRGGTRWGSLNSVRTPCGWLGPARGEFLARNSPAGPPPVLLAAFVNCNYGHQKGRQSPTPVLRSGGPAVNRAGQGWPADAVRDPPPPPGGGGLGSCAPPVFVRPIYEFALLLQSCRGREGAESDEAPGLRSNGTVSRAGAQGSALCSFTARHGAPCCRRHGAPYCGRPFPRRPVLRAPFDMAWLRR